jgi:hypothetical protein
MNLRALEGHERALGHEHPHTLASVHSLAYLSPAETLAAALHKRSDYGFDLTGICSGFAFRDSRFERAKFDHLVKFNTCGGGPSSHTIERGWSAQI